METRRHSGTTTEVDGVDGAKVKKEGKVARGRDLSARISFSSFFPFPFSSILFLFLSSDLKQMTRLLQVHGGNCHQGNEIRLYLCSHAFVYG